ncbi:MAG: YjbQ family protein [Nitrososphaeria archaeon]|nr:YjbQ family protein [Nitrososphaeria archaeon]
MVVETRYLELDSKGENHIIDLTPRIMRELEKTKVTNGIMTVFVPGSTGAVTTLEYEPGLIRDLPSALERIAPKNIYYAHDETWHDGNGHSHVRASLIGPSLTIPFVDRKLLLGTWQQVVFLELDIRPRRRKIVLQIIGE